MKKTKGVMGAVIAGTLVLSGVGISPLDVSAKTSHSTKVSSTLKSSTKKSDVSRYIKETKKKISKTEELLKDELYFGSFSFEDQLSLHGVELNDLVGTYKADSLRVKKNRELNNLTAKKLLKEATVISSELSKLKTDADVKKYDKKVVSFLSKYGKVRKDISINYEDLDNLFDRVAKYIEKNKALIEIIYGDDKESLFEITYDIEEDYKNLVMYEVYTGKRYDATDDAYNSLYRELGGYYFKYIETPHINEFDSMDKKIARGDISGAHSDYMTLLNGYYKLALSKYESAVKKAYDKAYKIK